MTKDQLMTKSQWPRTERGAGQRDLTLGIMARTGAKQFRPYRPGNYLFSFPVHVNPGFCYRVTGKLAQSLRASVPNSRVLLVQLAKGGRVLAGSVKTPAEQSMIVGLAEAICQRPGVGRAMLQCSFH